MTQTEQTTESIFDIPSYFWDRLEYLREEEKKQSPTLVKRTNAAMQAFICIKSLKKKKVHFKPLAFYVGLDFHAPIEQISGHGRYFIYYMKNPAENDKPLWIKSVNNYGCWITEEVFNEHFRKV